MADEKENGIIDGEVTALEAVPMTELAEITRGEVDTQVATAKRYPRVISKFRDDLETMALLDKETAISCFYTLKRGGNHIEGPSVRLAEMAASCWGNMRIEGRMLEPEAKRAKSQATAWDLEKNIAIRIEVSRRITDKRGNRYNDDLVNMTQGAALSIAVRNSIFRVVPRAFIDNILRKAKGVAFGEGQTLIEARTKALEWFNRLGIGNERILASLGRRKVDDIDADDLAKLAGLHNAIKEGASKADDVFPEVPTEGEEVAKPNGARTDEVAAKLAADKKEAKKNDKKKSTTKDKAKTEPVSESDIQTLITTAISCGLVEESLKPKEAEAATLKLVCDHFKTDFQNLESLTCEEAVEVIRVFDEGNK